jgi:hypothetical protein
MTWMTHRRNLLLLPCAAIALACCLSQPSQVRGQEVGDNWLFSEELGGWLDLDTGLVWGETASAAIGGSWSWNGANNIFLPNYRAMTGISAWRLPTVAELQQAYRNGAPYSGVGHPGAVLPTPQDYGVWFWTSQTKGSKFAYAVTWLNNKSNYWDKRSYSDAIPVYRAF